MKLIVGLGNPGRKYKKTRHNMGFMVVDEIISAKGGSPPKADAPREHALGGKSQKSKIKSQGILLIKPQTFMNQSGKAVKSLTTKYKIQTTDIIVIHDDIDLPFGIIRITKNRSSAGHKGVQSIIDELGTKDFIRIRIGINPGYKTDTEKFVLQRFSKQEEKQLKETIKKAVSEITQLF